MSREGGHHKKSMTRSATMKGRPSHRKGATQTPRQSVATGVGPMLVTPKDDRPALPRDRMFIAALPFMIAAIYHKLANLKQVRCFNCGASLGINKATEIKALAHPARDGRPLEIIGERCCLPKFSDFSEDDPTSRRGRISDFNSSAGDA